MLALAIEFSRCSRWLAPRELNSVPGRRGRPSPFPLPFGLVLRLSSDRVDRVVSASTWCFADCDGGDKPRPTDRLPKLLRKEVIQPHLPVRLPCYDFTPIADPTFDGSLPKGWATGFGCYRLSWCDGRCVQGPGTYSPQQC